MTQPVTIELIDQLISLLGGNIAISLPRRCGKSTIMRQLQTTHERITFLDEPRPEDCHHLEKGGRYIALLTPQQGDEEHFLNIGFSTVHCIA